MEIELNANSCSVGTPALAYSILWSPIPFITWILPFVGHMGIADSKGISEYRFKYIVNYFMNI